MMRPIFAFLLILVAASISHAENWLQFRGNDYRSATAKSTLPVQWDADDIAWKAELPGKAASGPIVVDGKVIVTSASGYRWDRLHVAAFDAASGKKLWHRQYWATGRTVCHPFSSVAANTPASDGKQIYAFFSSNDLICLDLDGNLKWYRGITFDYPTAANDVGMSASPCVAGDVVVVQVENEVNSLAMGIDRATGEERWKVERPKRMNWCSPTLAHTKSGKPLVLLQSSGYLSAHEPVSGKEVWRYDKECSTIVSPVPGEEEIFVRSGDGTAKILRKEDSEEVRVLWSQPKLSPNASGPVVHDGRIYTVNRSGVVACANTDDGEVLWQLRLKGPFWATPVLAGDKLYCINSDGLCQVVQLGDEGKAVGSYQLDDKVLGSPAVIDNAMYIRGEKFIWKIAGETN